MSHSLDFHSFTNIFYPSLIKSCQVKLLLKIIEYAPLLETVLGDTAALHALPTVTFWRGLSVNL